MTLSNFDKVDAMGITLSTHNGTNLPSDDGVFSVLQHPEMMYATCVMLADTTDASIFMFDVIDNNTMEGMAYEVHNVHDNVTRALADRETFTGIQVLHRVHEVHSPDNGEDNVLYLTPYRDNHEPVLFLMHLQQGKEQERNSNNQQSGALLKRVRIGK